MKYSVIIWQTAVIYGLIALSLISGAKMKQTDIFYQTKTANEILRNLGQTSGNYNAMGQEMITSFIFTAYEDVQN